MPVISVESLSKRYLVGHRTDRGGLHKYTALRDVIARELRNAAQKAADVVRGRQIIQGATVEEFWALRNVSFEVEEGEVLGIIGRNGAGKSTLLKILSRITQPTEGRVALRGRVASLLEVGTGFHPELSGRENIYLNGAILGMTRSEIRKKFHDIVAFAEVERFLDTPVKRYSSGMYVRLAFAVAAYLEPEILIVDEVLAVGDLEFQKRCLGKMGEVSRRDGRTVLFVSHNMAAVHSLCTRAILLDAGSLICAASTQEVISHYLAGKQSRSQQWVKPTRVGSKKVSFDRIQLSIVERPDFVVSCKIGVLIRQDQAASSMIAIDIQDAFGGSIMQALPSASPFVPGHPGYYEIAIDISPPPLIPGTYWMTFWIGPHNTETYDIVETALSFDVLDSPTPGRTFPHTADHGYIVPPCKYELRAGATVVELLDE